MVWRGLEGEGFLLIGLVGKLIWVGYLGWYYEFFR